MKNLYGIIEKEGSGYWIYFQNLPGCVSYGNTIKEAMDNSHGAVKEYIEASKELNRKLPAILTDDFKFEYKVSVQRFFKEFEAINMAAMARASKINASLLRQYATGKKHPSVDQIKKIEKSIHQLARELAVVQF